MLELHASRGNKLQQVQTAKARGFLMDFLLSVLVSAEFHFLVCGARVDLQILTTASTLWAENAE